jgi:hypothetical protein
MANEPDLQKGQSGEWVLYLQQLLHYVGYWSEDASGEFGDELEQAVMRYQTASGLHADGVVRAETWAALSGSASTDQAAQQHSDDPNERVLDVDWATEFPELHSLAIASDFEEYVRYVVGVDPAVLQTESDEPVA